MVVASNDIRWSTSDVAIPRFRYPFKNKQDLKGITMHKVSLYHCCIADVRFSGCLPANKFHFTFFATISSSTAT